MNVLSFFLNLQEKVPSWKLQNKTIENKNFEIKG